MKNESNNRRKSNKTVILLSCVVAVLVILIATMLLMIPKEDEIQAAQTTAPAPSTTAAPTMDTTPTTEETTEATTEATTVPEEVMLEMLPEMAEVYAENTDTVGWIEIAGTKLDYPVMFTPEDEEKYIRKSFEGNFSIAGVPFIDKDCSLEPRSDNIIIYGHNMYDGTAFHTMLKYDQKTFWEKNPTVTFSTLYEEKEYEILSCFYDRVYLRTENVFKFYNFVDAEDEADFDNAIQQFKSKSLYDTGVTAKYGDDLITLVTCAYHVDNGRFVIVAVAANEDDAAAKE